jgi:hypothetical protein
LLVEAFKTIVLSQRHEARTKEEEEVDSNISKELLSITFPLDVDLVTYQNFSKISNLLAEGIDCLSSFSKFFNWGKPNNSLFK